MHFENLIQESGHTNLIALPAVLSVRRAGGSTRPSLALQNVRPRRRRMVRPRPGFHRSRLPQPYLLQTVRFGHLSRHSR